MEDKDSIIVNSLKDAVKEGLEKTKYDKINSSDLASTIILTGLFGIVLYPTFSYLANAFNKPPFPFFASFGLAYILRLPAEAIKYGYMLATIKED